MYYVGLPYLALLSGAFAPRDVGLQGAPAPDLVLGWPPNMWAHASGQAAALAAIFVTYVAVLSWQARRAGGHAASALAVDPGFGAGAIAHAVYAEAHWSFYRALPVVLLGAAHWAALAGLAVWMLEMLLAGSRTGTGTDRFRLSEGLFASLSATFFALTGGNVWIAILLQIGARLAVIGLTFSDSRREYSDELIV